MTLTSRLEGRAQGLRADAEHCTRQAASVTHEPKQHQKLIDRATGYRIAADELQRIADEWRGTDHA